MSLCNNYRKWLHSRLIIKNRNDGSNIFSISSISDNIYDIGNSSFIFVRNDSCNSLTSIPALWKAEEAPGWFYFRPTVAQLDGSDPNFSGDAFVDVSSYEDVIDEYNRRIFLYELIVAYDSTDTFDGVHLCNSNGPPDTLCPENEGIYKKITDNLNSIVFRWPQIDAFKEIGCCNIQLDDSSPPVDQPSNIRDCSRIWVIGKNINDWQLRYYDFEEPSSQSLVSRGKIVNSGGDEYENTWHDLAWDTRNFLWGLEEKGLKRILPGKSEILPGPITGFAIAQPYATINDPSGILTGLFSSGLSSLSYNGKPAMSYSQDQEFLYIVAGDRFFELRYTSGTTWDVTKVSNTIGAGDDQVGDLAFDTFGNCYCVFNNNLARIDFTSPASSGFGSLSVVENTSGLLNLVTGLDFVLDLTGGNFITLYGCLRLGILYEINSSNGTRSTVSGVNLGPNIVGMSSCQAGEDLNAYDSFSTGGGPGPGGPGGPGPGGPGGPGTGGPSPVGSQICYIIDISTQMNQVGSGTSRRFELARAAMLNAVELLNSGNVQLTFLFFSDTWTRYTTTNYEQAKEVANRYPNLSTAFTAGLPPIIRGSESAFCMPGGLDKIFDIPIYKGAKVNYCVVLSASEFVSSVILHNCGGTAGFTQLMQNFMARAAIELDPNFKFYSTGINPTQNLSHMQIIGEIGGGGYNTWIG